MRAKEVRTTFRKEVRTFFFDETRTPPFTLLDAMQVATEDAHNQVRDFLAELVEHAEKQEHVV